MAIFKLLRTTQEIFSCADLYCQRKASPNAAPLCELIAKETPVLGLDIGRGSYALQQHGMKVEALQPLKEAEALFLPCLAPALKVTEVTLLPSPSAGVLWFGSIREVWITYTFLFSHEHLALHPFYTTALSLCRGQRTPRWTELYSFLWFAYSCLLAACCTQLSAAPMAFALAGALSWSSHTGSELSL